MKQPWLKTLLGLGLAAMLSAPAWAANPAQPGSINYIEGKAFIGSRALTPSSVGSTVLQQGQSISTRNGRAEVLLTPGVFLRLDDNSTAVMVSPSLSDTDVRLAKGRASVEVTQIYKENNLRINQDDATVALKKKGLYFFNANKDQLRVVKGKALVSANGKDFKVSGDRLLSLNASPEKPEKFNKDHFAKGDFYRWNSLRSKYLAEANVDEAQQYAYNYWPGTGWYWDPWFNAYTFIPGNGIFYSPFGWGYYSPISVYRAPFDFDFGPHYHPYHVRFDEWARDPDIANAHIRRIAHAGVPHVVERSHRMMPVRMRPRPEVAMRGHFGGFHGGNELHVGHFGGFRGGDDMHDGGVHAGRR